MFIFRFLVFLIKIVGTVFIVLFLQISINGRTLEEYLLSFLRDSEKMHSVQKFTKAGAKQLKSSAASIMQKNLPPDSQNIAEKMPPHFQRSTASQDILNKQLPFKESPETANKYLNKAMYIIQLMFPNQDVKKSISMENLKKEVKNMYTPSVDKSDFDAESLPPSSEE